MNTSSSLPSLALDVLSKLKDETPARGPRGGDLNDPRQQPEARRAAFTAPTDPATGLPALHHMKAAVFHDTAKPGNQKEQAWHRMAAFMLLAGRTNSEIALAAGVHVQSVSNLRTQRWFQELLATLSNEQGQDLQGAVLSHAHDAINRLAEIAEGDFKELGVRNVLAANLALLEHAKGKAVATVISSVSHSSMEASEEMASIQQQLAALRSSAERAEPRNITPKELPVS